MLRLLKKEIRLAMHPTAPAFLLLSAMLLIPNYPYYVVFFYTSLAVFFTCLTGRENRDVHFTLLLPVRRADVVKARFLLVLLLEAAQMLTAAAFALLRWMLMDMPNAAGMDANLSLFALALVMLGIFHIVFFPMYYKDVKKVGKLFLWGSAAVFVYILLAEAAAHTVPFVRDVLDTPDPDFLPEKLAVLMGAVALYLALTALSYGCSVRAFERQSL